ncbi:MAG: hypothetical protein AAGH79_02615 [Bacteroidota bacterium]
MMAPPFTKFLLFSLVASIALLFSCQKEVPNLYVDLTRLEESVWQIESEDPVIAGLQIGFADSLGFVLQSPQGVDAFFPGVELFHGIQPFNERKFICDGLYLSSQGSYEYFITFITLLDNGKIRVTCYEEVPQLRDVVFIPIQP